MLQLALWRDILPKEVIDLQVQWIKAINERIATEKTDIYKIMNGEIYPVFLSSEYHIARKKEMIIYDKLCSFDNNFRVFNGVERYLEM